MSTITTTRHKSYFSRLILTILVDLLGVFILMGTLLIAYGIYLSKRLHMTHH